MLVFATRSFNNQMRYVLGMPVSLLPVYLPIVMRSPNRIDFDLILGYSSDKAGSCFLQRCQLSFVIISSVLEVTVCRTLRFRVPSNEREAR